MTIPRFLVGLDLGQSQDPTALTIIERVEADPDALLLLDDSDEPKPTPVPNEIDSTSEIVRIPTLYRYDMRYMKRFPLQMSYPKVMNAVSEIINDKRLTGGISLLVDTTGVGAAVVDLLRLMHLPCKLVPVLVTFGTSITFDGKRWHVPKRNLATAVRILLESNRLKISMQLRDHLLLVKELQAFRIKITKANNDTYEAWRENDHDDLVFATAMCCWYGERKRPTIPATPPPSMPKAYTERKINDMYTEITLPRLSDAELAGAQEGWTWDDIQQRGSRG